MAKKGVDPRIAQLGTSVNDQVASRAIRHATYLERLKNNEVNQVVGFLGKEVVPDLLKQTKARVVKIKAKGLDTGPWTTQQLKEMTVANNALLRAGMAEATKPLESNLKNLAVSEGEWQQAVLTAHTPIAVDYKTPSVPLLKAIVTEKPMEGKLLRDWFKGLSSTTAKGIERQVKLGLAAGEGIDKIMARIKGDEGTFKNAFNGSSVGAMNRNARSVVRTAINHVTTEAKEEVYRANSDVIKGVQIVATLDSRTTEICMGQDGKVYPIDSGPRPPFHFNCRTTTAPVTKSWQELGLPLKENKAALDKRASMNGQVAGDITYGDWIKKQPAAFQDEVLGPEKAQLLREGKVEVEDFTKMTKGGEFKTLTVDQLKEIEDYTEFAATVGDFTPEQTLAKIKSLVSQLKSTSDPTLKKAIRTKLRIIDKNWKTKYDASGNPLVPKLDASPTPPTPKPVLDTPPPEVKPKPFEPAPAPKGPDKPQISTQLSEDVVDANLMHQVGPQAGSNPGGLFQDVDGTKWYVKSMDADRARNEVLAAKLYQLADIAVPDVRLASWSGKVAVASKIEKTFLTNIPPSEIASAKGTYQGFAVDAWLANWDVVGLQYDNLKVTADFKALRVDTGGALKYRAKGALKGSLFGDTVGEIDSLRSSVNPAGKAVFGGISDQQLMESMKRVEAIDPAAIRATIEKYGPLDHTEREALIKKMLARREDIIKQLKELPEKIKAKAELEVQAKIDAQKAAEAAKNAPGSQVTVLAPGTPVAPAPMPGAPQTVPGAMTLEKATKINSLLDELAANPDKATSIRAQLRKLGHKGGLKAGKVPLEGLVSEKGGPAPVLTQAQRHVGDYETEYKTWRNSLSSNESNAIRTWSGSSSGEMRRWMYKGEGSTHTQQQVFNLEKALARAPRKQVAQWRGIRLDDAHLESWKPGHIIVQNSVDSYSTRQETAKSFASWDTGATGSKNSVLIEVRNKFGIDIRELSSHPSEYEHLSPRGTRLRILQVVDESSKYTAKRFRVIAEELTDDKQIEFGVSFAKQRLNTKGMTIYQKIDAAPSIKYIRKFVRSLPEYSEASVTFAGMDMPNARIAAKQLARLAEQMPDVAKRIKTIGLGYMSADTLAIARVGSNDSQLIFNKSLWRDSTKLKAMLERTFSMGHLAGNSVEHVVAHEFGHIFASMNTTQAKAIIQAIAEVAPTATDLSKYGAKNADEAFAESFGVMMTQSKDKWSAWLMNVATKLKQAFIKEALPVPTFLSAV